MKVFAPKILLVALAAASLAACSPSAKPETPGDVTRTAENNLMDRHDSLMTQAGHLFELREKISSAHAPNAAPYLHGLQASEHAMMAWMNAYHAPDSTAPAPQRLAYFHEQQQQLAAVEKQMHGTIDSASVLLKQAPAPAAPATH